MASTKAPFKPEIMSPAGYWPQLHAAVEAGADAVYFGLKHFSARAKVGFSLDELPAVLRTLHSRGVKGYLTFNTLVFDHELTELASFAWRVCLQESSHLRDLWRSETDDHLMLLLAISASCAKAFGSFVASSERTRRSTSMPAAFKPWIKRL